MIETAFTLGCGGVEGKEMPHVRALRLFLKEAPVEVERAIASLALFLEGINASPWQEVAWSFSRLTGDGFPLEFGFSSADEAVRYTAEVAGPEVKEEKRLDHALRHLVNLAEFHLPEEIIALFYGIQASHCLRYGAWASGRHGADGDNFKLYIEVPPAGEKDAYRLLSTSIRNASIPSICNAMLVMIGYDQRSQIEFYFRTNLLEPYEIELLMRMLGLTSHVEEFFNLIEEVSGASIQRLLSTQPLGFSIADPCHGKPGVFSLFTTAGSVFGSDMNIRRRMLELGFQKGWRLRSYESISEPLTHRTGWNTLHGILSFISVIDGPPILHIGLRPPEASEIK